MLLLLLLLLLMMRMILIIVLLVLVLHEWTKRMLRPIVRRGHVGQIVVGEGYRCRVESFPGIRCVLLLAI